MELPVLYHWSPAERREEIRREGLRPFCRANVDVWKPDTDERVDVAWYFICLAPEPSGAWRLSGDIVGSGDDAWDLWEVKLDGRDEVHVMPEFGGRIKEVRVRTPIPPDRVWWVGTREAPSARELGPSV